MTQIVVGLDLLLEILRVVFLALAMVAACVAAINWLVRTRRVNQFGQIARLSRRWIDPLMEPVARRVVRSGGLPSSAPFWSLAVVVVSGIVALTLVTVLRNQLAASAILVAQGYRGWVHLAISLVFQFLRIALLVRVISSWFGRSDYSRWFRWSYVVTEPIVAPLQRIIPRLGAFDISPIIAFFGLGLLESLFISILLR